MSEKLSSQRRQCTDFSLGTSLILLLLALGDPPEVPSVAQISREIRGMHHLFVLLGRLGRCIRRIVSSID